MVWNSLCLVSVLVGIVVGIIWNEESVFEASIILDTVFTCISFYFVVIFALSITKIRVLLQRAKTGKYYVN